MEGGWGGLGEAEQALGVVYRGVYRGAQGCIGVYTKVCIGVYTEVYTEVYTGV